MSLHAKSLFLYGLQVTELNSSLDFRAASGGPILEATITLGFYSLSGLATEIEKQLHVADQNNNYTVTIDRTLSGGTANRVSITTDGNYLDLLFGTGPRSGPFGSSVAPLIGFNIVDYTGSLLYTGSSSSGTPLIPNLIGYNFLQSDFNQKVFGSVNISASGIKEAIVYSIQKFIQVQFKYEPALFVENNWVPFFQWAMQQREFDFTPEITSPNNTFEVTLESSMADGKGLAYMFKEMLPQFPDFYDTGMIKMRLIGG